MVSRADVDRCLASRASHRQNDIAAVTTNSGTSSAPDLACANTFPPLHGHLTTCAGQPSHSVFWKLLEREDPQPENAAASRLESRQNRSHMGQISVEKPPPGSVLSGNHHAGPDEVPISCFRFAARSTIERSAQDWATGFSHMPTRTSG